MPLTYEECKPGELLWCLQIYPPGFCPNLLHGNPLRISLSH